MTNLALALIQCQPDVREPRHKQLLAVLKDRTVLMQHDAVIGVDNDTGTRIELRDGLLHPMQGDQCQQRGDTPPLWRPCGRRKESVMLHDASSHPGFWWPTDRRRGLRFGQQSRMTDTVEALGDINFQRVLGPKLDVMKNRFDR